MSCFDIVVEKLKSENINFTVEDYEISWPGISNEIHFIRLDNFDCKENNIAWFQSSNHDSHLLRICENGEWFGWEPITHNPVFGCDCHLLEWYKGHLIFIYREKHDVYICTFKNKQVNTFNFHGEQLERKDNILLFKTYGPETENIRRIKIPELIEIESIPREIAKQEGLLPKNLDIYLGMVLKNK